jgi:hypothetical protein
MKKNWTLTASAALIGLTSGCTVIDAGGPSGTGGQGHPWAAQWNEPAPAATPVARSAPVPAAPASAAPAASPAPARTVAPAAPIEPTPTRSRRVARPVRG